MSSDQAITSSSETQSTTESAPSAFVDLKFQREADGSMTFVNAERQCFNDASVLRLFPLTSPDQWISVFSSEGIEVACIASLDQLQPDDRRIVAEALKRREFVPEILKVRSISSSTIPCQWEVDTDRGPTRFILDDEKDVRILGPMQVLILDAHGIRYLIRDLNALDATSRRIVERYI